MLNMHHIRIDSESHDIVLMLANNIVTINRFIYERIHTLSQTLSIMLSKCNRVLGSHSYLI